MKKLLSLLLVCCTLLCLLAGCSKENTADKSSDNTATGEKKTLVFGDTTFNAENEEADVNPHNAHAGWACIRYGVGETLFRYSDSM